jgi:hypothetical protein
VSQSTIISCNQEQMFDRIIRFLENAKTDVLAFFSSYTLVITTDNELFQAPKWAARARGVNLRYITEITKDNLSYCKRQLNMVASCAI